jgi:hypothetical protein
MKNVLFVSAALDFVDSSASNRNRLLIKSLSKICNIYSIEFVGVNCSKVHKSSIVSEKIIVVNGFREISKTRDICNHTPTYKYNSLLFSLKSFLSEKIKMFIPDFLSMRIPFLSFSDCLNEFGVNFDYVITSSDPKGIHFFNCNKSVKSSAFLKQASFFQYWGDPLYGDVNMSGTFIFKFLERYFFGLASKIFFVSEATLNEKKELHPKVSDLLYYLPRCLPLEDLAEIVVPDCNLVSLSCSYVGDFNILSRDICPLVDAISLSNDVSLTIAGNGDVKSFNFNDNVSYLGRVPQTQADNVLFKSDIIFVILNKKVSQIPGKIFDLAVTNKFVVILYECPSQIEIIPFRSRFVFCQNQKESILSLLSSVYLHKVSHPINEYRLGETLLLDFFKG